MAPASTIMRRMPPTASSFLVRHRHQCRRTLSAAAASISTASGRCTDPPSRSRLSPSSSLISWQSFNSTHQYTNNIKYFSAVAQEWDGDGDDDTDNDDIRSGGGGGGDGPTITNTGGGRAPLLPTKHSRHLPPPVCPPSQLRTEVESIFDAPIGSLIVYTKPTSSTQLKSAEEEMADAYYASDAIVQRVEYIMRGLNAAISENSFVGRSLNRGAMTLEEEEAAGGDGDIMSEDECFRAMLDLMERMAREGQTYDELRTRVRSQILDPASVGAAAEDSSSSSSSDDSSSDSDNDEELAEQEGEDAFDEWTNRMEENMSKVGIANGRNPGGFNAFAKGEEEEDTTPESNQEEYQFGADPGITTHMYDLVLDSLACLCDKHYNSDDRGSSFADLVDLMPEGASPPELAKEVLDIVLNRHWMDGGDIGLGGGGFDNDMNAIARGVGTGVGTGSGSLAKLDPSYKDFDVRTVPTPMTFNAVMRIAANFDPVAYAEAVENAKVLSGDMGNAAPAAVSSSSAADQMKKQEQERLRDVTIDAAMTTYSRMQYCKALTLRTLDNSSKKATSREALKRQARLLADNYKGKRKNIISGRNAATYSYLIQTIGNCVPPSLSRGNMAIAIYHKGCTQERVMDEKVVGAMRAIGGYDNSVVDTDDIAVSEKTSSTPPPPPISNGPLFDAYMQRELGEGVKFALDKGRGQRYDQNYKMRRHVEWDDTY